ncbi:hypothetical protein [Cohnella caldifontis]|uniref:hypothetical protein n=1 Tax=Cohnella caldifontis TaxID=3027471 RepID=UPI0023EACC9F|nr:hypothetical protein [Cohnella sp. YIM B05605]
MVMTYSLAATWAAIGIALAAGQRISRKDFAFSLLFFMIVNTHVYNFMIDLFRWMSVSGRTDRFAAFLLYRSIIVPAVLSASMALSGGRLRKWGYLAAGVLVLAATDGVHSALRIIVPEQWNPFYAAVYYALLAGTGVAALSGFRRLGKERAESDEMGGRTRV